MFAYVKFVDPEENYGVVLTDKIRGFEIPFKKCHRYRVFDEGIKKKCLILCVKGVKKSSAKETPVDLNDIKRPPPVGYVRLDTNKIHLGHGVWLPKSTYDNDVFTAGSSFGLFVKNVAVSVFGAEYLKSHSVTGKSSNKTKSTPRPAIDPTKALAIRDIFEFYLKTSRGLKGVELLDEVDEYEEYIRQKISDLNRPPRAKKVNLASKNSELATKQKAEHNSVTQLMNSPTSSSNTQLQLQQKTPSELILNKEDSSSETSSDSDESEKSDVEQEGSNSSSSEEKKSLEVTPNLE